MTRTTFAGWPAGASAAAGKRSPGTMTRARIRPRSVDPANRVAHMDACPYGNLVCDGFPVAAHRPKAARFRFGMNQEDQDDQEDRFWVFGKTVFLVAL